MGRKPGFLVVYCTYEGYRCKQVLQRRLSYDMDYVAEWGPGIVDNGENQ
jgi:hypothetical protein